MSTAFKVIGSVLWFVTLTKIAFDWLELRHKRKRQGVVPLLVAAQASVRTHFISHKPKLWLRIAHKLAAKANSRALNAIAPQSPLSKDFGMYPCGHKKEECDYLQSLLRKAPTMPTIPVPTNPSVPGSGACTKLLG